MAKEPILASKSYHLEHVGEVKLDVRGGLCFIRGNNAPYFSLTYWERGQLGHECGGADHEHILKHFPQFADLAALHMSDIDGVPMHADANGWYWLAGTLPDGFGERYHGGNQERLSKGRHYTSDECLDIFAKHIRVSLTEAARLRDMVFHKAMAAHDDRRNVAKAALAEAMAGMRPRWKAEAEACIAKHSLVIYGDTWNGR